MNDSFSIFGAFLVEPRPKLNYNGQFLLNLTIVYYMFILIRIIQFQDILYFEYFISRFQLARTINYQNQTLVFDDDVTKRLSKIRASSFESRHPRSEKPSKIFFALWTQLEVAVARPEHQTMSILFIFGLSTNKMVVFVVVARTCSVVTRDGVTGSAKQLDSRLVQRSSCVMCGVRVMTALFFFCFACKFLFVCFVVDPMFVAGDLGHEFAQSA
jgi:hypothetical protein